MSSAATEVKTCRCTWEKPCKVCKTPMLPTAKFCTECHSYQDWRRNIPGSQVTLSLLIALVAVITPAVTVVNWALHYNSHTSAASIRADRIAILAYVWNTGRNPSAVLDAELKFEGVPLENIGDLLPADPLTSLVAPNGHSTISFTLPHPVRKAGALARNAKATLWLRVQESNGNTRCVPASLGQKFIDEILGST